MSERKNNPYLPVWFALILIGGIVIGLLLSPSKDGILRGFQKSPDKLKQVINYVEGNYVDTVGEPVLEEDAIKGMLQALDPHSVYIAAAEFHEATDPLLGSFEGIGVQFRLENDSIVVIIPVAGGPSEKVGVKAGDRIVEVDGKKVTGKKLTNEDVMRKLKGKKGTKVSIKVFRRGFSGLIGFTIIRDVIPTYSLDIAYMIDKETGYARLNNFSATTHDELHEAILKLKDMGMKKFILDLRGNGGGYLQAAIDVADEFLPDKDLIVYTRGTHHPEEYSYAESKGLFENGELIVLIDELTASAAEIVAGAIQDNDRGLIMGRRSFGKGLVQEQLNLKDGSAVRLTVARYFTPSGRCIQRPYNKGTDEYYYEYYHRLSNDEQGVPDTSKVADSLKFRTKKGKIVYGGGGIMPDIYSSVEKDSTLHYFNLVSNKGLIYQFAFDYTDKHRPELNSYKTFKEFDSGFKVTDLLYSEFIAYAVKSGVKHEGKDLLKADDRTKVMIKAYVGRNVLDNEGFFPLLNSIDPVVQKAMENLKAD